MRGKLEKPEVTSERYIDLDEVIYDEYTLRFLRKKLDEFALEILRQVALENKQHRGLAKTRLEDYRKKRPKYDDTFLILEAQGFIETKKDGTSNPYYITIRGRQLIKLLTEEKKLKKEVLNYEHITE